MSAPGLEAWHEAGHAVITHVLGARVVELTLESDEAAIDGLASIKWPGAASTESRIDAQALCALAGPLAELAFEGRHAEITFEQLASWGADWRLVQSCLDQLGLDAEARHARLSRWVLAIKKLFAAPEFCERVARVADMLEAHGTLDETLFADAIG